MKKIRRVLLRFGIEISARAGGDVRRLLEGKPRGAAIHHGFRRMRPARKSGRRFIRIGMIIRRPGGDCGQGLWTTNVDGGGISWEKIFISERSARAAPRGRARAGNKIRGQIYGHRDFNGGSRLRRTAQAGAGASDHAIDMSENWKKLCAMASAEVDATLGAFPRPLRERAAKVAVTYEPSPNVDLQADGIEADTLGLFTGAEFVEENHLPLPPQIILFLKNLWDYAEGDEKVFREEVRTTFLHELGHYLGLDEDDLFDRELD